jgi:hypothetical protein
MPIYTDTPRPKKPPLLTLNDHLMAFLNVMMAIPDNWAPTPAEWRKPYGIYNRLRRAAKPEQWQALIARAKASDPGDPAYLFRKFWKIRDRIQKAKRTTDYWSRVHARRKNDPHYMAQLVASRARAKAKAKRRAAQKGGQS